MHDHRIRCVSIFLIAICIGSGLHAADVVTVAGNGQNDYSGDGGLATQAAVAQPFGIVVGPDNALYICEVGSHAIRRVDPETHVITTVAGNGQKGYSGNGGLATEAKLNEPYEVRFSANGDMYFVEMQNHIVRKVDAKTGRIELIAGDGTIGFGGDDGPAINAKFSRPHSIALDNSGNLYVCDIGNHRVRKVDLASGIVSTFAGTGERKPTTDGASIVGNPLNGPRALDFDGDHTLILALREGNAIYKLDLASSKLHHVAGTGKNGYTGDGGPARLAKLSGPKGVALGPDGDIYFADTESHTIRVVSAKTGTIETVIGDGKKADGPDGDPHKCRMDRPHGIFVDKAGRIYVGDSNNHRVRMLAP
ncbi:MAG: hypothetical protein WBH28_10020 [Fuerstiella sp.]